MTNLRPAVGWARKPRQQWARDSARRSGGRPEWANVLRRATVSGPAALLARARWQRQAHAFEQGQVAGLGAQLRPVQQQERHAHVTGYYGRPRNWSLTLAYAF